MKSDALPEVAAPDGVHLRPWQPPDAPGVAQLVTAESDPLWLSQFHALHRPDMSGTSWRRSIVAVDGADTVIGCASAMVNALHPGRLPCAVDVAPGHRRRGVGFALLSALRRACPQGSRLSTKVRASDGAAQGFLASAGGRTYQQCPSLVIDPQDPVVRAWATGRAESHSTDLAYHSIDVLADIFVRQYLWVHEDWSPVGDHELLAQIADEEVSSIDPDVSAGVRVDGRLAAVAFAFESDQGFEVVAETVDRHEPGGIEHVADVVSRVLAGAADRGGLVEFDGHVSDPHLHPVLSSLPYLHRHALDLVEIG